MPVQSEQGLAPDYMGYSVSEIWSALDPKITIPAWQDHIADYKKHNEAAQRLSAPKTFRYADYERGELDFYNEGVPKGAPALIMVHGGGFSLLSKEEMAFAAPAFNAAGIAYISPGYPLAPGAPLAELLKASQDFAKWIYEHAEELGIDKDRIYISGGSAGAYISAYLLTTDWTEFGLPRSIFAGGMLLNGVFDARPLFLAEGWKYLGIKEPEIEALSPISRIGNLIDPILIARGEDEPPLTHLANIQMGEAAAERGLLVDNYVDPGSNHFTMIMALMDPDSALFRKMTAMIDGQLGEARPRSE